MLEIAFSLSIYFLVMLITALTLKRLKTSLQMTLQSLLLLLTSSVLYAITGVGYSFKPYMKLWYLFLPFIIWNTLSGDRKNIYIPRDAIFAVAIFYPISEELLFRGVVLWHTGSDITACFINGIIFSGFHALNWLFKMEKPSVSVQILRFVSGFLLALTVIKNAGSIFPAIFFHCAINLSAYLRMYRHIR